MYRSAQMEEFSRAYFRAVAAVAGFSVAQPSVDHDSIDWTVYSAEGRRAHLDVQLKCTAQGRASGDNFSFRLALKNYEELRLLDTDVRRVLVVVTVPSDAGRWTDQSERRMILRRCGYWISLTGYPPTSNTSDVTIHLPRANLFTPAALSALMKGS